MRKKDVQHDGNNTDDHVEDEEEWRKTRRMKDRERERENKYTRRVVVAYIYAVVDEKDREWPWATSLVQQLAAESMRPRQL